MGVTHLELAHEGVIHSVKERKHHSYPHSLAMDSPKP